jgi:hypothetical protein
MTHASVEPCVFHSAINRLIRYVRVIWMAVLLELNQIVVSILHFASPVGSEQCRRTDNKTIKPVQPPPPPLRAAAPAPDAVAQSRAGSSASTSCLPLPSRLTVNSVAPCRATRCPGIARRSYSDRVVCHRRS